MKFKDFQTKTDQTYQTYPPDLPTLLTYPSISLREAILQKIPEFYEILS